MFHIKDGFLIDFKNRKKKNQIPVNLSIKKSNNKCFAIIQEDIVLFKYLSSYKKVTLKLLNLMKTLWIWHKIFYIIIII